VLCESSSTYESAHQLGIVRINNTLSEDIRKPKFFNFSTFSNDSNGYVRNCKEGQTLSPQVVLGFCPCGPFRLNISQKKDRKNKISVNCVSHIIVENLKQSLEITYNKRL